MQAKLLNCFIAIMFFALFFAPSLVFAEDPPKTIMDASEVCDCTSEKVNDDCKKYCGNYQVNDFLLLGVRISKIILGLVGALALLAFVVGGTMFLVSAGNKNLVDMGKSTIIGAVIGLVVVFASYTIIYFTASALGVAGVDNIFNSGWFNK